MLIRFVIALLCLLIGALAGTFLALVATNGYGTAGINETALAVGYVTIGLIGVGLLAWLCATLSGRLRGRLGWPVWVTLPFVLLLALIVELLSLPLLAIILAEISRTL